MKKIIILTITSAILLSWITNVFAAEFLGYSIVVKQAKFYFIIFGLIGASVLMVSAAYISFWLLDLRTKKAAIAKPAVRTKEAFGGEFVAVAQPAK